MDSNKTKMNLHTPESSIKGNYFLIDRLGGKEIKRKPIEIKSSIEFQTILEDLKQFNNDSQDGITRTLIKNY